MPNLQRYSLKPSSKPRYLCFSHFQMHLSIEVTIRMRIYATYKNKETLTRRYSL